MRLMYTREEMVALFGEIKTATIDKYCTSPTIEQLKGLGEDDLYMDGECYIDGRRDCKINIVACMCDGTPVVMYMIEYPTWKLWLQDKAIQVKNLFNQKTRPTK